jgi:hypothetical protein
MPIVTCGITEYGPVAEVAVAVSTSGVAALVERGRTAPTPVRGRGLFDTGSTYSFIDQAVATRLDLALTGYTAISTVTPGSTDHFMGLYDAALSVLGHGATVEFTLVRVVVCDLSALHVDVLIGRDILDQCLLYYNGPAGLCTLAA